MWLYLIKNHTRQTHSWYRILIWSNWRALRRISKLPYNYHTAVVERLSGTVTLFDSFIMLQVIELCTEMFKLWQYFSEFYISTCSILQSNVFWYGSTCLFRLFQLCAQLHIIEINGKGKSKGQRATPETEKTTFNTIAFVLYYNLLINTQRKSSIFHKCSCASFRISPKLFTIHRWCLLCLAASPNIICLYRLRNYL